MSDKRSKKNTTKTNKSIIDYKKHQKIERLLH